MKTPVENTQEQQHTPVQRVQQEPSTGGIARITDNRPTTVTQRKLKTSMEDSTDSNTKPIQRKNSTGLPDTLKSGIENLSGYSMDDVKVHYNSSKPVQLQAHAYAQGTDIHLAPGQQKHLPHEAWHVVQQKQGRVKPTRQLKSKVNINDDAGLEKEADVMGSKAINYVSEKSQGLTKGKQRSLKEPQKEQNILVAQRIMIVGEAHTRRRINTRITATGGHNLVWRYSQEPSKVAAALIHHNGYAIPANYAAALNMHAQNGTLRQVMRTARAIHNGQHLQWGGEDNVIYPNNNTAADTIRTQIENPNIRAIARGIKALSLIHNALDINAIAPFYNLLPVPHTVLGNLNNQQLNRADTYFNRSNGATKNMWRNMTTRNGVLLQPQANQPLGAGVRMQNMQQQRWARATVMTIQNAFNRLLASALAEMQNFLSPSFNNPIRQGNQGIAAAGVVNRYGGRNNLLARMHTVASISRTATQLSGMDDYTRNYYQALAAANANLNPNHNGFIIGNAHLLDIRLLNQTNHRGQLQVLLNSLQFVDKNTYENQIYNQANPIVNNVPNNLGTEQNFVQ